MRRDKKNSLWILWVGETQVRLYESDHENCTLRISLTDPHEKTKLHEVLKSAPWMPLRILIETSTLQFQYEPMPHLSWWDRLSYLKHKAQLLGPDVELKDVRPEKGEVMSSFMNPSNWVSGWLDDLPLAYEGIYFYPLEILRYGEFLDAGLKDKTWLFLGATEEGFLRQLIVDQGKILLARLTKLPENMDERETQAFISKDLKRALSYLKKKDSVLLSSFEGFTSFRESPPGMHLKSLASEHDFLTTFLKWWSCRKPSKWVFFPPNYSKQHNTNLLYFIKGGAVAALAFLIALNTYWGHEIYDIKEKTRALEIRLAQYNYEKEKLKEETENFDIPHMKSVLETHKALQQKTLSPLSYLQGVASVMRDNPEISILDFHWGVPLSQEGASLVLHIKTHEDEDHQIITDLFEDFKSSLQRHFSKGKVIVIKAPFNANSEGLFSGSTNQTAVTQSEEEALGLIEVKLP